MKKIYSHIKLLRPHHYIKNVLVLLPLIFSKNFLDTGKLNSALLGVIAFCLISSVVYIINDIKDVEKDRSHPVKCKRPIASGEISFEKAIIDAVCLVILTFLSLVFCSIEFGMNFYFASGYLLLYLFLNIAYSFGLKDKPIIDVVILVLGFLIRVLFGGVVIQVEISGWLYLTVISISFYLGLGKRRNELVKHNDKNTRNVLKYYNKEFLDKNMNVCLTLAICFYALWAMNYENNLMLWSVPLIMIMAMKYSYNIEVAESEGDPVDVILKDKWLILLGILYAILVFSIIYIG